MKRRLAVREVGETAAILSIGSEQLEDMDLARGARIELN